MKFAEEAGILQLLAKLFKPIVIKIFPELPKEHPAIVYILSNITANIFGLGNAATPMGLKAMQQMKELSSESEYATRSMITFLAMNTSGFTRVTTTVIVIRMQYDSLAPTELVGTTIIARMISTMSALIIVRFYYYKSVWRR